MLAGMFLMSVARPAPRTGNPADQSTDRAGAFTFERYLDRSTPAADGFDFPVGGAGGKDGYTDRITGRRYPHWYVAARFAETYRLGIHPGEDWNGSGGGNTDLGQPVHAIARGRVLSACDEGLLWGRVVRIRHEYFENHERRLICSLYAHLGAIRVNPGQVVEKGQIIGEIGQDPEKRYFAHLHLELRRDPNLPATYWPSSAGRDLNWVREHYLEPSAFIRAHRRLFIPNAEPDLLLIHQATYRMRYYRHGSLEAEVCVSLGQGHGSKERRDDRRTPRGMYFVIDKKQGSFGGTYGAYYGGYWIKINYPNRFDAERGRHLNWISASEAAAISDRWEKRQATLEGTPLGGGIGLHSWIADWDDRGPRHLSWGCVVLHPADIRRLYDRIPLGAMVVIF